MQSLEHSPSATRLALKIVRENFGDICHVRSGRRLALRAMPSPPPRESDRPSRPPLQDATKALIDHGTQSWAELARVAGLPPATLRQALQVLLQQNLVNCYLECEPPTLRGPGPSYHLYQANLPRALQSLRCACLAGCGVWVCGWAMPRPALPCPALPALLPLLPAALADPALPAALPAALPWRALQAAAVPDDRGGGVWGGG